MTDMLHPRVVMGTPVPLTDLRSLFRLVTYGLMTREFPAALRSIMNDLG